MLTHLEGKKILVTGGTGFLGRHLVPLFQAAGAEVSVLCRSRKASLPPGVLPVHGDCSDLASMTAAVKNRDIVIHAAGLLFGLCWQDYLAANGRAAQNLGYAVTREPKCSRVVFISSLAASGPCGTSPGRSGSAPPAPVSAYGWSKYLAERILASLIGPRLVVLRPPIIYGSWDRGLLPLFRSAGRGIGLAPRSFPVSLIHADDCAHAIALVCAPHASGTYHLSDGKAYAMAEICAAMAKAQGRRKIFSLVPPRFMLAASAALASATYLTLAKVASLLGKSGLRTPAWNWDKYRESVQPGWLADSGRIKAELGFAAQMSLAAGMAEAVNGYRQEGWL